MARAAAFLALLAVCAAAPACGGDGGGSGGADAETAPQPPPRDRYVAALDRVCKEEAELRVEGGQNALGGAKRYVRELRRVNAGRRTLLGRYEQIAPPPEQRRFHRRYVDAVHDQVALTERLIDALRAGRDAAWRPLTGRLGAVLLRRGDLIRGHPGEFEHCGRS